MTLMTPRNLVPATPMRFSGATESTTATPRVIKGPQKSGKDKSTITLPPGYVDRAAQRRSGLEATSNLNVFDTEIATEVVNGSNDPMKNKLEFLNETAGIEGFPTCSQIQTERLMKHVLGDEVIVKRQTSNFKDNEVFLQFKSIEESKIQPFDPFNRPRKVFRASSGTKEKVSELEDELVIERVKEAVKRLEISSERHEKYFKTLTQNSEKVVVGDDIFPEVGIFDEKATFENVINNKTETSNSGNGKIKAKNRLFASKSTPKTIEKEFDIFELIAQKPLELEEENNKKLIEESDGGGLFGFSNILPKLSRLESENNPKGTETKLTGAYASILSDEEGKEDDENRRSFVKTETEEYGDDYLYPGHLENDPNIVDSDEEIIENDLGKMSKNKRKLARKEDKEVAKVEKLVKTKFGVDLSK